MKRHYESLREKDLRHFEELIEERKKIEILITTRETTITQLTQTEEEL